MIEKPLAEYLKHNSQSDLAAAVGRHQTAISRMLRVGRNITVVTHDDGRIQLLEKKVLTKPKKPKSTTKGKARCASKN